MSAFLGMQGHVALAVITATTGRIPCLMLNDSQAIRSLGLSVREFRGTAEEVKSLPGIRESHQILEGVWMIATDLPPDRKGKGRMVKGREITSITHILDDVDADATADFGLQVEGLKVAWGLSPEDAWLAQAGLALVADGLHPAAVCAACWPNGDKTPVLECPFPTDGMSEVGKDPIKGSYPTVYIRRG